MKALRLAIIFFFVIVWNKVFANSIYWQSLNGPSGGTIYFLLATTFKNHAKVFAATPLGIFSSNDHGEHWNIILPGYVIHKIIIDPLKQILYAGSSRNGIFISKDHGVTWAVPRACPFLTNATINDLAIDQSGTVYIGTENGIYYSTDNGEHWSAPLGSDPTLNKKIQTLDISASNSIYAVTLLDYNRSDLFQSLNSGKNWQSLNLVSQKYYPTANLLVLPDNNVYLNGFMGKIYTYLSKLRKWKVISFPEIVINTKLAFNQNILYAGFTNGDIYSCQNNCDVFNSWQRLCRVNGAVLDFSFVPDNYFSTIYAATSEGVYASFDVGQSWKPPLQTFPKQATNILARDPVNLYAGLMMDGVALANIDKANSWRLPQKNVNAVKLLLKPLIYANNIYAVSDNGLYFSNDYGSNWKKNLNLIATYHIATDSAGTIFINNNFDLLRSSDHGATWATSFKNKITCLATLANKIFVAGVENCRMTNVYASSDHGQSWISYGSPELDFRISELTFANDETIYAGGYSTSAHVTKIFYKTCSENRHWEMLYQTTTQEYLQQLLPDAHRHNIYAVTASEEGIDRFYFCDNSDCKLNYSTTSGNSIGTVILDQKTNTLFRYDSNHGLWMSHDHGVTWKLIPQLSNEIITDVIIQPNTEIIYVGTFSHGVYQSLDHGITWQNISAGLNPLAINYLVLDNYNHLYTATLGGGMYVMTS